MMDDTRSGSSKMLPILPDVWLLLLCTPLAEELIAQRETPNAHMPVLIVGKCGEWLLLRWSLRHLWDIIDDTPVASSAYSQSMHISPRPREVALSIEPITGILPLTATPR